MKSNKNCSNCDDTKSLVKLNGIYYCNACLTNCFLCEKDRSSHKLRQFKAHRNEYVPCSFVEGKIICTDCLKMHAIMTLTFFNMSNLRDYELKSELLQTVNCPFCAKNEQPDHLMELFDTDGRSTVDINELNV